MSAPVIARGLLVATAVAAALLLLAWQRDADTCTDSVKGLLFALRDRAPAPALDETIASVEGDCDGTARLIDAGGVLLQQREPARAARVFREASEREPDSFSAWAGLALALAREDPEAARAAAERAGALNPFYRPPS